MLDVFHRGLLYMTNRTSSKYNAEFRPVQSDFLAPAQHAAGMADLHSYIILKPQSLHRGR